VIALDILRTFYKEPAAVDAYFAELAPARGSHPAFDRAYDHLTRAVRKRIAPEARQIAELMALTLQAALLWRHGAPEIASGFCHVRLNGELRGISYGASCGHIDVNAVMARQTGG
jgi:putative acyl-CoA dehydrogenase